MPSHRFSLAAAAAATTAAAILVACADSTAPGDTVGATARGTEVTIVNRTRTPVFTFVVGARTAALIYWGPCVDAARCAPLAPGATRRDTVPEAATEGAMVYWWHAVRGPTGALEPDAVRAIPLPPR